MDLAQMQQIATDLSALTSRVDALEEASTQDAYGTVNNYQINEKGETVLHGGGSGLIGITDSAAPFNTALGQGALGA